MDTLISSSNNKKIAVVGYDLEIIDLVKSCGYNYFGYIDNNMVKNDGYLGTDADSQQYDCKFVFGMQYPKIRKNLWEIYKGKFIFLSSPIAYISNNAEIHNSSTIQHFCMIMPNVRIGKGCQINARSSIHHESYINDFCTIGPGAIILGRVNVGKCVYIGAGAVIRDGCCIGDYSTIGAGAVVVSDVGSYDTVFGVPAKSSINKKNA